ncbi:MAG: hypothetical protein RLZZ350_988 [Verrucomicrobiota bacterium]|jgi:outer membrane lipoprotein SlyB
MKLNRILFVLPVTSLMLTGCVSPYDGSPNRTGTGALTGGALGAGTGALIGSTRGHAGEGALIGAAVGLLAGGLVGHSMDQEEQSRLRAQAPQTYERVEQGQPLSVADIKALSQAHLGDDVIISQIKNSRAAFRLSSADIIDLHNSGVNEKVIDAMINTASSSATSAPQKVVYVREAPPAPRYETVVVSPSPGYVWCGGEWIWDGGWAWTSGRWCAPPQPATIWIGGSWSREPRGWRHSPGHWR